MPREKVGRYEIDRRGRIHYITPEQMEARDREFARTGKTFHLGEVPDMSKQQGQTIRRGHSSTGGGQQNEKEQTIKVPESELRELPLVKAQRAGIKIKDSGISYKEGNRIIVITPEEIKRERKLLEMARKSSEPWHTPTRVKYRVVDGERKYYLVSGKKIESLSGEKETQTSSSNQIVASSSGKPVRAKDVIDFSKKAKPVDMLEVNKVPFVSGEAKRRSRILTKMLEFEREQKRKERIVSEVAESPQIKSVILARDLGFGTVMTAASGAVEAVMTGKDIVKTAQERITELKRETARHFLKEQDEAKLISETAIEAGLTTGMIMAGGGTLGKAAQSSVGLVYKGMVGLQTLKTVSEPSVKNIADTVVMSIPLGIDYTVKGIRSIKRRIKPTRIDVSFHDVKGISLSEEMKVNDYTITKSKGRFVVETKIGKVRGRTRHVSIGDKTKTLSDTVIDIPEQTVGKIKIGKQRLTFKSKTPKTKNKVITSHGSESAIDLNLKEPTDIAIRRLWDGKMITEHKLDNKGINRILSGTTRTKSKLKLMKEETTPKGGGILRKYKGHSVGVRFDEGEMNLGFVNVPGKDTVPLITVEDILWKPKKVSISKIDWTDITTSTKNIRTTNRFIGGGNSRHAPGKISPSPKREQIIKPKMESVKRVPDIPTKVSLKIKSTTKTQPTTMAIPIIDYATDIIQSSTTEKTTPRLMSIELESQQSTMYRKKDKIQEIERISTIDTDITKPGQREINLIDVIQIQYPVQEQPQIQTRIPKSRQGQKSETVERFDIDTNIPDTFPPIENIETDNKLIKKPPYIPSLDLSFSFPSITRKKTKTRTIKNPLAEEVFTKVDVSLKGLI